MKQIQTLAKSLLASLLFVASGLAAAEPSVDFSRDVRPILVQRCYRCHSSLKQESNLRLDRSESIQIGSDNGAILVAGKSSESRLIQVVSGSGDIKMPPEGEPLAAAQIEILKRWIDQGAKLPASEEPVRHWSFVPPTRPTIPPVSRTEWVRNPIDNFIGAKHDEQQLAPVPPAAPHVLLRRIYLDLVGYPPTAVELRAFLADTSPDAYEKVVAQLLNSPAYGERWGRHWMDVWRYSDWDGYGAEVRESQPHIWRWRDWIIESLNADKPYNRMIVEMLAGDELAPDDPATLRATGYLVRSWYKFNRHIWLDQAIEHTGKAFLGVTFNCARCHDHMYDPIAQLDYFKLRAVFEPYDIRTDRIPGQSDSAKDGLVRVYDKNLTAETFLFVRGDEKQPDKDQLAKPSLPKAFGGIELKTDPVQLPIAAYYPGAQKFVQDETLAAAVADVAKAEAALTAAREKLAADQTDEAAAKQIVLAGVIAEKTLVVAKASVDAVAARIAADRAATATPPAPNAKELALAASQAERSLSVAQAELGIHQAGQKIHDAEQALNPADEKLKKALTDAQANLPKVTKTRDDALANIDKPSETYTRFSTLNPTTSSGRRLALANWIAADANPLTARVAVNHLWLRHFGAPLVPTVFDFGMNGKAPSHPELLDWLAQELIDNGWQMKRLHFLLVTSQTYRMASSESLQIRNQKSEIRNSADPDNRYLWRMNPRRMEAELVRDATLHVSGQLDRTFYGADIDPARGQTLTRRSIYFRNSKEKKMTFLSLFDCANPVECYRRTKSVAPQQALAMANSPLTLTQARVLARTLVEQSQSSTDPNARFIAAAFEQVLNRSVTAEELTECQNFLAEQAQRFANLKTLTPFVAAADNPVKPATDPNQRARENLVHVLMNHNDFVTIR